MSLGNLYVVYSSFFLYNFIEKLFNSCSFYRRWLFIRLCTNRWWMMWHHRRRSRRRRCRRTRARTRVYWTGCSIWSITATAVWTTTRAHTTQRRSAGHGLRHMVAVLRRHVRGGGQRWSKRSSTARTKTRTWTVHTVVYIQYIINNR